MRFDIAWGDQRDSVDAPNAEDAWSAFCARNSRALKHPNLFPRSVIEYAVESDTTVVETVVAVASAETGVVIMSDETEAKPAEEVPPEAAPAEVPKEESPATETTEPAPTETTEA